MSYYFRAFHIPERMMGGITRYIEEGVIPGDFLQAVITNDLRRAVEMADEENMFNLPAFVSYFYNHGPISCWGSMERMQEWAALGGKRGAERAARTQA